MNHYFVDGAVHVCQTGGACEAAKEWVGVLWLVIMGVFRYTCEECVQGLEWVEAYIEDPIMVAEYTVYLEQNFCLGWLTAQSEIDNEPYQMLDDWEDCKELVVEHFAAMHMMAMEKFFIPVEICNQVN